MRNYDLEFLKRFSMVIGLLALVTLGLILLAAHLHRQLPPEISPTAASRTAARIHPAGAVYAGDTGAGGAPMLTHAAWDGRVAQGFDTLVRHSIDGFTGSAGIMPPRGGNPSLTDEQVRATVDWMLANLK